MDLGFFPIFTLPAKFNDTMISRYSLIDQVWINFNTGRQHSSGIVLLPLTDHFLIFYAFKTKF